VKQANTVTSFANRMVGAANALEAVCNTLLDIQKAIDEAHAELTTLEAEYVVRRRDPASFGLGGAAGQLRIKRALKALEPFRSPKPEANE
jgi:hypothetical protein